MTLLYECNTSKNMLHKITRPIKGQEIEITYISNKEAVQVRNDYTGNNKYSMYGGLN